MAETVRNHYATHLRYVAEFFDPRAQRCAKMFLIERLVLAVLCLLLIPTISTFIRWIGGLMGRTARKIAVELYVV